MSDVNDDEHIVIDAAGAAVTAAIGVAGPCMTLESLIHGMVSLARVAPGFDQQQKRSMARRLLFCSIDLVGAQQARRIFESIVEKLPS